LSHTLLVSYVCPVISSAARKLPRRITINKDCATSTAGVFSATLSLYLCTFWNDDVRIRVAEHFRAQMALNSPARDRIASLPSSSI
jgi:hypothetical protein